MRKLIFTGLLAAAALALTAAAEKQPPPAWMRARFTDLGSPTYADRFPEEANFSQPLQTPRGNTVSFRLNLLSPENAEVKFEPRNFLRIGDKLKSGIKVKVQPLIAVHVEGNTQWPVQNFPGGTAPENWRTYQIRTAPFDLYEVVDPAVITGCRLEKDRPVSFLVTLNIPEKTEKGLYRGDFVIESAGKPAVRLPITVEVSSVKLPERFSLDSNHWLFPEPVNLTSGKVPEYWSEEHWKLLENSGKALLACGDNMIYTPIIFAETPLIQTVKTRDGRYEFDFSGFRRWITTFRKIGFTYFAGTHMSSWMLPLYVQDQATGQRRKIALNDPEFVAVLNAFMPRLRQELEQLGALDSYRQYQKDEPREKDLEAYRKFAEIRKKHLPGVRSIDAVLDRKNLFADLVDIQVLNLPGAHQLRDRIQAAPERYWLYNCTSPYPPFPNRHLDRMPVENRLWPLIAADFGASGFLNWAANVYRGADEYKTSLGPMPNGSQKPGHPPGDNWFLYRGPEGLRPGVRMLNYRDGLVDATLYAMLARKNPEKAKALAGRVIFPDMARIYELSLGWREAPNLFGRTYSADPAQYNVLRGELLRALEKETR